MSQRVEVEIPDADKTFVYQWDGEWWLIIGDRVLLPSNWRTPEPFWGTVVSVEPTGYDGPLAKILEVRGQ